MKIRGRGLLLAITLLAFLGILISLVSLYHHYGHSKTSYCDVGESFNCDVVNRSSYSRVFGVPVALIGVLGYSAMLALSTVYRSKAETPAMMLIGSASGLAFASYLTYIEGYVLYSWCILCLTSLGLILTLTVLSAVYLAQLTRQI